MDRAMIWLMVFVTVAFFTVLVSIPLEMLGFIPPHYRTCVIVHQVSP